MMPRPKALIFDVFGTLVDWRQSIAREVRQIIGSRVDGDAFARAWRGQYQPSMAKVRDGKRAFVRLDHLHMENLRFVLNEFGIDDLSETDITHLNQGWHRLEPWPDVRQGLELLKPHFLLAPCSNGNTSLMLRLARHAQLPWDTILGAEPAQAYKPDAKTYLCAADWLGLPPNEVMMVAAHNDDLAAAQKCGLQTGFFPRPDEYGDPKSADLQPAQNWTVSASNLLELAKILAASQPAS